MFCLVGPEPCVQHWSWGGGWGVGPYLEHVGESGEGSYGGEHVPGASTLMEAQSCKSRESQIRCIKCGCSTLTGDSLTCSLSSCRTTAEVLTP